MPREQKLQVLLFAMIGGSVLLAGAGLMLVLVEVLHWDYWGDKGIMFANAIQLAVTLWMNFKLNKKFTFKGSESPFMVQRFLVTRLIALAVNFVLVSAAVKVGMHYLPAVLIFGALIGFGANYYTSHKIVFTDETREQLLADPDKLRLDRWTALYLVGTLFGINLLLIWATGALYVPVTLTVVSLLCFAMAMFHLYAQVYAYRNESSLEELRLPAPVNSGRHRTVILMPARKGEPQQYAYTLLNAAWTQRFHWYYRLAPLIYDDDHDGARNILAVRRTIEYWRQHEDVEYHDLELFLATELEKLPNDGSPLAAADWQMLHHTVGSDELLQVVVYPIADLAPGQNRSKPIKLNLAYQRLGHRNFDVWGILDAETQAAQDLLTHVDRALQDHPEVDGWQGPVQLMQPRFTGTRRQKANQFLYQRWFAHQNLLEYYRCFMGLIPLQVGADYLSWAGNTIFIRTSLLRKLGDKPWPEKLTEDNAAGTKAAVFHRANIRAFFNPELASREETPTNLEDWLKQRMRWGAGFADTLLLGEWRMLEKPRQRMMAFWIMSSPFLLGLTLPLWAITFFTIVFGVDSPPSLVLVMWLPIAAMVMSTMMSLYQMRQFGKMFNQHISWYVYPWLVLTQLPYQFILSVAAFLATKKRLTNNNEWHTPKRSGDNLRLRAVS